MFGLQPQLIALFCVMFIALGIFNILMARRRQRQAGSPLRGLPWYRQMGILTGIEYILLASAFLLNISIQYQWLPANLNVFVLPVYLVILLSSGLLAGIVIYQGMQNSRRRRGQPMQATRSQAEVKQRDIFENSMTPEEQAAHLKKRRERRQKAAAARRRRSGKA